MQGFRFNEKCLSQIPALQQLINLGFEYLPLDQALAARQGKTGNVLLEDVLREQLRGINRIHHKGREYLFSEENIQSAVQKLKNLKYDGLLKTNEAIHELLTLGTSLEQTVEGDTRSFNLRYVDWDDWRNNRFHVAAEFSVERTRSTETARPDIVLFVNGIPFAVIECKSPKVEVEQAISQSIRNQRDEYIPKLFVYSQLVLGVNKNAARYATTGTPAKFWSLWKERQDKEEAVAESVHHVLPEGVKDTLFSGEFAPARRFFDALEAEGEREITEQDWAIHSLCRPERLLELVYKFTVFDAGIKKIARYQQYFAIKRILTHVKQRDAQNRRRGGIVWHTQGSGKSLTMVMLARALAQEPNINNPRIVLVTDRKDLDKQLKDTFAACDMAPQRARTGRDLLELVSEKKAGLVTTLVHKFDKALNVKKYQDTSSDIFMLIDESHRTQFGNFAARMRQMFPNACYLGFTGTPLMKKEKNNFAKFGGLIDKYSIDQAVADGAIVPLLYEGRHVEMEQNEKAIDLWFSRHTQGLTDAQRADLKKKYARAEMLNKTDQVIYMRAFDISEHFRANWQGTGYKAQLVAPSKAAALRYHEYLEEIGFVSSEVIISGPDSREGYDDVDDEPTDEVVKFWQKMIKRYGSEEEYNKQIINCFKYADEPEILIVVDKLLTGFDAPRNTVLYLTRILREHTLLQAIARVNRIYEDEGGATKEFGYIVDYASVLGELDRALSMYSVLDGFEDEDLAGTLIAVQEEVAKLPQRYSDLWDLFNEVRNQYDEEAYEVLLADDALREEFYERLSDYSKTLGIALSVERFIMNTPEEKLRQYKNDLKRFQNLKASVKLRYAEAIDYRDYEPKIRKLLDTHISASEVVQLNAPVNIFDEETFSQVKEDRGVYGAKTTAAKADAIAHATKKAITEKMEEDPAFYEKFSKLIQQAIDDFKAKRLSDLEYLQRVSEIREKVVNREHDDMPEALQGNDDAMAYYGILKPYFDASDEKTACDAALTINDIVRHHWKVHFWDDLDAQKQAMNDIDDYLYDEVRGERGIDLSTEQMDEIIEKSMQLARHRMPE
ncbi:type I restriction endonuclease subunit R [Thiohalobacter sp. IOR34]|uniref:type I restriction endonuclease subunit R n=1 Tax=Thiohalobacter sp. IOR34 TaxID=3057176 RepID=UPI0025AF9149|nr:type I restriction endonuclease subunit R [Thiohalobacter sp. IOR34]WJW75387.1 type I restriction endonuclease subunit R [Thiohalobacter sp. IOR34]